MSLYKKSFEVKEAESALGGFTTKYTIEGQAGYQVMTRTRSSVRLKNLEGTDVNDLYQKMTDKILEGIAKYNKGGSNFIFKQILSLEIHTVQYEPLGRSSYIELP